ncbi:MAG: SPOR domain-containing protein [Bacteroidaceae bacterium]|nr:SPOR domain-containing protein [Bacteroidaceae bacterium]
MKKILFLGLAIVSALTVVSCKSTESSYKKAYEKARAQETAQQATTPVQVTPVITETVPTVAPVQQEDYSDLRTEKLTAVNGASLQAYNVVCGSFRSLDNANNLRVALQNKGYAAVVAQNPETGMYRVIASSSSTKAAAISARDRLRATYADAWILYRTY